MFDQLIFDLSHVFPGKKLRNHRSGSFFSTGKQVRSDPRVAQNLIKNPDFKAIYHFCIDKPSHITLVPEVFLDFSFQEVSNRSRD